MGTCEMRNEIETKRNKSKRNRNGFLSISFCFGKFRFVLMNFVSIYFVSISFRILQVPRWTPTPVHTDSDANFRPNLKTVV
jgi:hypothetical protein